MKTKVKLSELRSLQRRIDTSRRELGISPPGTGTFLAPRDGLSDEIVVVEADGFGGATTAVVEGNYPVDYIIKFEKSFPSEREAEIAAEAIAFDGVSPRRILGILDVA